MAEPIKHYLQFADCTAAECAYLFERAALIKRKFKAYEKHHSLSDRTLAMIFEKASTRTRVSFDAGMYHMGRSVVHLTSAGSQLGRTAPTADTAPAISPTTDILATRTFAPELPPPFAGSPRVPPIYGPTY